MISDKEYKERRDRLLSLLQEDSACLLFCGEAKKSSADDTYPFEANRNFYYLTGIIQEGAALLLTKESGSEKEFLFLPPDDPKKVKWYGKRVSFAEGRVISGIDNVLPQSALKSQVSALLNRNFETFGDVSTLYLDLDSELKIGEATSTEDLKNELSIEYPDLRIIDCYPLLTELRLRKSPGEVAELEEAIRITNSAILSTISKMRPGVKEYELADTFLHTVNDLSGYQGLSFNTIMAAGKNATILHYPNPQGTLGNHDLLLMDLGARYHYYNADISRTFPVNGVFEGKAKELYEIVLGANKLVIKEARPGKTIHELQDLVIHYYEKVLVEKGYLSSKEDLIDVYFHSVSHFIGLDTHDPYVPLEKGLSYRDVPLEPGMIISDEPGLYFANLGIGIRIEDDLLITEDGCRNLSDGIVKEIDDIERLLSSRL